MDNNEPTYIYVPEQQGVTFGIVEWFVTILLVLGFGAVLLGKAMDEAIALAADPIAHPYAAIAVAAVYCTAAYVAWRIIRRVYFIIRALCYFFYDKWLGIRFYLRRKFR
ncbi:hypothetical protein [Phyllobacterium sp. P30BS-XVII]|uniref:hypothetical protein n=1 Tax=Phyllobacterium sp. P30BS-XVII TaxID=2587046 RepID=UPI0015FBD521|nr:hypothetical protein [Phyllobacterium sp. P30BS-XVII]MBA8904155.1 hypothetical protein [Phyllobacterium sp. P30BS-XVII]